jgi:hypothetical protein
MMSEHDRAGVDLSAFLAEGRERTEKLVEGYFSTDSWAKRGGFAQLLVKELSNLLAVRDEVLRPVLTELQDGHSHLRRLDDARIRQLDLLAQLDDLSIGVGPRDVHQHQPNRIVSLIRQLRSQIDGYNAYEADDLVPFIEASLDQERREELGQQASKASRRGPTHAHLGKPPANERSTLTKAASGLYDRLHDMAQHPEEAVETGGEQEP